MTMITKRFKPYVFSKNLNLSLGANSSFIKKIDFSSGNNHVLKKPKKNYFSIKTWLLLDAT
jgi:hypothetical protein